MSKASANQNKGFEDRYWAKYDQEGVYRHEQALKFIEKGPVLDIGCGDGFFLELLKKKGIKGVGIDVSGVAVEKAKAKGLDVAEFDFLSEDLPYKDEFECVIALDVLEHLLEPQLLLKKVRTATKNHIVVSVPNFSSFPARVQMLLGKVPENNTPRKGHMYWFNLQVLKDTLQENGFVIESIKWNHQATKVPILAQIVKTLSFLFPSLFALSFVVKATKK